MAAARMRLREARLLLVIGALERENREAMLADVLAVDFLLAHPAVLKAFIALDHALWPEGVRPSPGESDSSEETFLRWKRSVSGRVLAPLLGRLVARALVTQPRPGGLALSEAGVHAAAACAAILDAEEGERVRLCAGTFLSDRAGALERLRRSLVEAEG